MHHQHNTKLKKRPLQSSQHLEFAIQGNENRTDEQEFKQKVIYNE